MLSKTIAGIFVLLATAFIAAYGQSSGLPSGIPQPELHITPDSLSDTYAPQYGKFLWNDISGKGRNLGYNYPRPPTYYDSKGYKYVRVQGGTINSLSSNWIYYPDVFIVSNNSSGNFTLRVGGPISFRQEYSDLTIGSGMWRLPNTSLNGLSHLAHAQSGTLTFSKNGVPIGTNYSPEYSINMNIEIGSNIDIYEFLVFQNLTNEQRLLITEYLMDKYDLGPVSKHGLTMWLRADKGVYTWPSDNLINGIIEQAQSRLFWNFMEMPMYLDEYAANGMPAIRLTGFPDYIVNEGGNGDEYLVNGRDVEFFAVLKDGTGSITSVMLDFGNEKKTYMNPGKTVLTEQIGNGPAVDVPVPANLSFNNWRIYNVSIGGGYQSAYINKTRMYHQPYTSTENIMIRSVFLGVRNWAYPFKGYLAELIIYNRKLTDAERESVKNYLMQKYSLN